MTKTTRSTASLLLPLILGCTAADREPTDPLHNGDDVPTSSATTGAGASGVSSGGASTSGGPGGASSGAGGGAPTAGAVSVHLVPQRGVTGMQRINFAVPLAPGALVDETLVRVEQAGAELSAARRALARHPDGSVRSVQLQVELSIGGETDLDVAFGAASTASGLELAPVEDTLVTPDGTAGPSVWALLPAAWLSGSGVVGPLVPEADVEGTPLGVWNALCDYDQYDVESFLAQDTDGAVWLYDRGTVNYRGYARRGDLHTLESAYRETAIYRSGLSGSGSNVDIGVPGKSGDLKYFYAQNMAIHYLMTGDDRFREGAEGIAETVADLWDPTYSGNGSDFWTERHAGFTLLAHVWAMIVSDDQASHFRDLADEAVKAFANVQASYPAGYDDPDARCFAHDAAAHDEPFGYFGCSPWMSAILADGLDTYATERGGAEADAASKSIVELGRIVARDGRDGDGRPFYWMGVGTDQDEADEYDEHWGESAYIVAMAYHRDGKQDAELGQAANEIVAGLGANGVAPHMRSFNWQCRSAVATPFFMK